MEETAKNLTPETPEMETTDPAQEQEKIELEIDGFVFRLQKNEELSLDYYQGDESVVTVPADIEGHPVTMLNEYAFAKNETITKVILPESIREIGNGAFGGCPYLEEIVLPSEIELIDSYAFTFCPKLQELHLPEKLRGIHRGTFEGCTSLHTLHLPDTLNFIGPGAFSNCTALTELHFADGLERILDGAFADSGIKAVHLPGSLVKLGKNLFGESEAAIHAPADSLAAAYADEHVIPFVIVEE